MATSSIASEAGRYESVGDAYAGRCIFVTGATGFLGKVFIEKLLYSCPNISKIYILIRRKARSNVDARIKNMFELPLFDRLRNERPQAINKLCPIEGDIELPNLGIKPEDEDVLVKTVSMVFHIAATVRFNEPLETALRLNVKSTIEILKLCQRIREVKAFVYVSTAFSNTNLDVTEELIYPPPIPLAEVEVLLERPFFSEEETNKILNGWYNTYTFTKAIAEQMVEKYRGDVPAVIVRPSIVISTLAEPVAGWIDNWFGATGIVVPTALGINRTVPTDGRFNLDLIPVDYVASLVIVAAAKFKRSKDVVVYNICTSGENSIALGDVFQLSIEHCVKRNYHLVPYPKAVFSLSTWLVNIILYLQYLPAILFDCISFAIGRKPRLLKFNSAVVRSIKACIRFTSRTWVIRAKQTCALYELLSDTDKKCFVFNPRDIVWKEYIPTYMEGVQLYLLKKKKSV